MYSTIYSKVNVIYTQYISQVKRDLFLKEGY